jgi:hypothetical protein
MGINLVKLHGSLDMFVQGDDLNYLKLCNRQDPAAIIDDVDRLWKEDASSKEGVRCTNEITYTDEDNVLQFLRLTMMSGKHKYSSFVQHTMDDWFLRIFQGHLNYVEDLACVGYSFHDRHVDQILYDWLVFAPNRRMVIVNPAVAAVPSLFRHLTDQVELRKEGFLSHINTGSDELTRTRIKGCLEMREFARKKLVNSEKT